MGIISPGKVWTSTPSVKEAPHKVSVRANWKVPELYLFFFQQEQKFWKAVCYFSILKSLRSLYSTQFTRMGFTLLEAAECPIVCSAPSGCSVFSQTCSGAATWPPQTAPILCCGQGSGFDHRLLPSSCSSLVFPLIPLPGVTQTNKHTLLVTQLTVPSCCALRLYSTKASN